ncbi:ABC transporter permease [Candidatus Aminicenantes bacterium AC-335-A11]|jgi:tungstate transport system permease protein|nr:ABC transporter permease [SCandidatus Aminicenantes bacterium Aminicenantia_JdfR_composite]MCP2597256.1 ABC transporter permease [Candidatus Aminicenantes bacterium AC-335-G13]MCP2618730.1 ABC transporter permease [Candidatus Aminicenantes bacterium AC-335-A11]
MNIFLDGLIKAFKIIENLDPEILKITWLTIKVSGTATFISLILGIPFSLFLALRHFPGRKFLISMINTGMGLPPVVVGLFVALILWRSGPLGSLNLIYTPIAMIIAQIIIAFPIIAGFSMSAFQQVTPDYYLQALALGASRLQAIWAMMKEARLPALAAVMAGFGGVISEVGAVLMVGGNIKDKTRVLTTAIVLETRMGKFGMAIALSVILLFLTFSVNYFLTHFQQRGERRWIFRSWR